MSGVVEVIVNTLGPQGPPGSGANTYGGDLAFKTATTQTVVGIQNIAVPVPIIGSGAQILVYNDVTSGGYAWETASQLRTLLGLTTTLAGDVTGAIGSNTLSAIDGKSLPAPSGTNVYLKYSGTALSWSAATLSNLAGDVTGAPGANTLSAIDGIALPAPTGSNVYLKLTSGVLSWSSASGTGATSLTGDVTGTVSAGVIATTLAAIEGYTFPTILGTTPGYGLIFNGTSLVWGVVGSGGVPGALSLSGDTTGTISGTNIATTLVAIDGNSLPSPSGSGTVLTWSGSALSWASGGGSPTVTLTGDVTGSSASPISCIVDGLRGQNLPTPVGVTAGYSLQWNGSALVWGSSGGGGGGSGITSLYNDVTTPLASSGPTASTVVALSGSSGAVTVNCNAITWAPSNSSPGIGYAGSGLFLITVVGAFTINAGGTVSINSDFGSGSYISLASAAAQFNSPGTLTINATGATQIYSSGALAWYGNSGGSQIYMTIGNSTLTMTSSETSLEVNGQTSLLFISNTTTLYANNQSLLAGAATSTVIYCNNTAFIAANATTVSITAPSTMSLGIGSTPFITLDGTYVDFDQFISGTVTLVGPIGSNIPSFTGAFKMKVGGTVVNVPYHT